VRFARAALGFLALSLDSVDEAIAELKSVEAISAARVRSQAAASPAASTSASIASAWRPRHTSIRPRRCCARAR